MNINIHPSVRFWSPVCLFGDGTLVIEEGVGIGFFAGAANGQSIMLQPRYPSSYIRIGKNTQLSNGVEILAVDTIVIADNCRIGKCLIVDSDFHGLTPESRDTEGATKPIVIGNDVFIGQNVTILKGVHIGDAAVIGAGSVVTQDIPARTLVAGNPARIIREI